MANSKKYWQGFEDLVESPLAQKFQQNEFAEEIPTDEFLGNVEALGNSQTSRRDFLKYLGFTTAAATLAACEAPVIESIPYVVKPDTVTPGVPTYYASTFFDGYDYAPVLVKTREGRPIKLEPNDLASFNAGTNARVQASVLSLYDSNRLREPMVDGKPATWSDALAKLNSAIQAAGGKQVVLMTSTIISPSTNAIIKELQVKYPNVKHVVYDSVSISQKLDIYQNLLGERAMPRYRLDKAEIVVSIGSDFLGDWNGQSVAAQYAAARKPGKTMLRHIQVESILSLTGSNADKRVKAKPSEYGSTLVYLTNKVAAATGHASTYSNGALSKELQTQLDGIAKELVAKQGKSLVLVGGNDIHLERFALAINMMLQNIDTTVDITDRVYLRKGNDADVAAAIKEMAAGNVAAVITSGVNPAYSLPGFAEATAKVATRVAITERMDETANGATMALPTHHYLESWGDYFPKKKYYTLAQPTISPLFDTMQMEDVLLNLAGSPSSYKDYLKGFFASNVQPKVAGITWNTALQNGVLSQAETELDYFIAEATLFSLPELKTRIIEALIESSTALKNVKAGKHEIFFYQKTGIGSGTQANNPWLHELPDPVTRICWDNYLTMSAADAIALGFVMSHESNGGLNGGYANLTVGGKKLEKVPVFVQPGQALGTVGLSVGYGRTAVGKAGDNVGVNAYSLTGDMAHWNTNVTIEQAEGEHRFASVQMGHTMMGRKIVNEVTLTDFVNGDPHEWNHKHSFATFKGPLSSNETNLWDDHDHETLHMWNMSIDLNSCTGCGACVVACHIENNVPIVGKEEVRNFRDMHWLRIDRYYSSDMSKAEAAKQGYEGVGLIGKGATDMYAEMELPSESPDVVFQPVMCQHCNHAPCETVCPVAATSHSREGLNHMAYNRCIGTRYCANNCPYKVRRFNWFNYMANDKFKNVNPSQDDYGRMVLNPDVNVRSRGVMEKCSMCVQRIQYAKLEAKKKGSKVEEGAFTTACAQACASGAIIFGDVNNKQSTVLALKTDDRAYHLLEEVGTQPSVFYQTKVRNRA